MTGTVQRRVTFADVERDMVVTFTPRAARSRVTVLVHHTTHYPDNGLSFIFGTRCDAWGRTRYNGRTRAYLLRPDALIVAHEVRE